jgi:hypothetical protein
MKNHHHGSPIHPAAAPAPSHEDIARRAHELWSDRGQPQDRDQLIWLEAEGELRSGRALVPANPPLPVSF